MSYCLLWIETLLACLLFAAMLIILGLRRKTRTVRALCAVVGLLPLLPLGLLAMATAGLRFASGLRGSGFMWAILLLACYLAGAVAMRIFAGRRDVAGVRHAFSWPLGRIATTWLVVVSLIAMTLWNLDLRAQMEIQALRAEAGAIALSVASPQVPDSANAAWVYEEADKQFQAATTPADKDIDYSDLDLRSAPVKDYLQRQHKTLETLRRAADMPECRLDYDYAKINFDTLMPQLSLFRQRANLLAFAATAEAASGNLELALADGQRLYSISNHVSSFALRTSGLVAIGIDALADMTIAQVLPSVTTSQTLDRFATPDARTLRRLFARCLRGEEAFGLAAFCDLGSGKGPYAKTMAPIGGTVVWLLWLQEDVSIYREYLQRLREIAQEPYYQTAPERKQIEEELQPGKRRGVLSAITTPSLLKTIDTLARAEALRSTVAVACAATRYRLDHGDYPATANLLVPQYLETMPLDPFDGQPLRLKKLLDGSLVIYSVSTNGKDNGGNVDGTDAKHPIDTTDKGIILKLPPAK